MSKYLAVYDREDGWKVLKEMPWKWEPIYSYTGRKTRKSKHYQDIHVYPKPEEASCFIQAHQLVEASSMEEAWHLISTFPKPSSEMLSQSLLQKPSILKDATLFFET